MSASLTGTMNGMDVQTQYEALQKELAARAAQEREAANQQAQQALMGYQQQAAAPPPQLSPSDTFIPTLIGNIASVLSQDQGFRQRAQEGIRSQRQDLMTARVQNLQALRDNFTMKAQAAEEAGDTAEAEAARLKVEQLSKTADQLLEQQRQQGREGLAKSEHGFRMAEIKEKGKQDQITAGIKKKEEEAAAQEDLDDIVESIVTNQTDITNYPIKQRGAIVRRMAETNQKILPKKVRDSVKEISAGREALTKIKGLSEIVNSADWRTRHLTGMKNTAGAISQKNPDAALYESSRQGLLAALSRATGERGVLTNQDVERARTLLPTLFDSKAVAQRKTKQLEEYFDGLERRVALAYTEKAKAPTTDSKATQADIDYVKSLGIKP